MSLRIRLRLIAVIILLVGFGSAFFVYLKAENVPDNTSIQEFEYSKRYVRNLRVYGGEMAVVEDEIRRWFESIWQGTSLAYTVACITILISCGFLFAARILPVDLKLNDRGEELK